MSSSSDRRSIEKLLSRLEATDGWRVERVSKRRRHHMIFPPDGRSPFTLASTPSDWRWKKNLAADLRRAGWDGMMPD